MLCLTENDHGRLLTYRREIFPDDHRGSFIQLDDGRWIWSTFYHVRILSPHQLSQTLSLCRGVSQERIRPSEDAACQHN